jgi:predicted transcriptional regulator of viral defense system
MQTKGRSSVSSWVEELQRRGRITFSLQDAIRQFPSHKIPALRNALTRLVAKGRIVSVWKGFYAIIPVEYSSVGMIPPVLYIDDLMAYLGRPYYISLFSAAVFYGAAHQRPQEFSVITSSGSLRASEKKDVRINFKTIRKIDPDFIIKKKTKTGYVNVSCPELTATDLVRYEGETGGLNRAATVLNELGGHLQFGKIPDSFFSYVPAPVIRRTGYLFDKVLKHPEPAEELYKRIRKLGCSMRVTPLKTGMPAQGYVTDRKWGIIINTSIEIDE